MLEKSTSRWRISGVFSNDPISNSSGDLDAAQDTIPPVIWISSGKIHSSEPCVKEFSSKAKIGKLFFGGGRGFKVQIFNISSYEGYNVSVSTTQPL